MKLLGSTKSKVTKDENGESVPCLETIINRLVNYQTNYIYPKNLYS